MSSRKKKRKEQKNKLSTGRWLKKIKKSIKRRYAEDDEIKEQGMWQQRQLEE